MPISLADLPADVRHYLGQDKAPDAEVLSEEVLSAIGLAISKLRDEAKTARESSGIEARWRDAEEAYAGIDDVNRGEVGSQWTKSMSLNGPITSDNVPDTNNRSTLYPRMTARYVDAAAAKVGEIILAPGVRSFSLSATPLPDLIEAKENNSQVRLDHLPGAPLAMRAPKPGELLGSTAIPPAAPPVPAIGAPPTLPPAAPPVPAPAAGAVPTAGAAAPQLGAPPAQSPLVPVTVSDLAKEKADRADKSAKKAEKRIYDWHVECRRERHVRKVVADSSRLGVGVLKGPFPQPSKQRATRKGPNGIELGIRKITLPASKWVNVWNFYPDPTCGEDIQDGDHVFEREWAGERQVRKLKESPGYIISQIDKVIIEGPQKINIRDGEKSPEADDAAQLKKGKYEIWYFYGMLTAEEMGCVCDAMQTSPEKRAAMLPPDKTQVYAIVTLINNSVVKAAVNPLETGEFPYHAMSWQRRTGSWAGVGIAEQIATPQKMLTAAIRSMLDNAGISAGGQIVIDTSIITPADGDMGMGPHKIWYLNGEGERLNVNEAFGLFKIDNVTAELMQIVDLAMKQGEEATSIPLITQGQSGPTTPDTYGAAALQNNNANQLLRDIGYRFDDSITVPETNQYYEYLILDPDVPDDEKGDWTIDAHGSSALVDMALEKQFIGSLAPYVVNPVYEISPAKWSTVYIEANRVDPKKLKYTDEEIAALKAQQPAAAPQIEVAKINAQTRVQEIAARSADAQADNARADRELLTNVTVELHTLQLKKELAMLEYSNRNQQTLTQAQAELAKTTMTLQAQERLNEQNNTLDLHKHHNPAPQAERPQRPRGAKPLAQAPDRAAPGQAFSQSETAGSA